MSGGRGVCSQPCDGKWASGSRRTWGLIRRVGRHDSSVRLSRICAGFPIQHCLLQAHLSFRGAGGYLPRGAGGGEAGGGEARSQDGSRLPREGRAGGWAGSESDGRPCRADAKGGSHVGADRCVLGGWTVWFGRRGRALQSAEKIEEPLPKRRVSYCSLPRRVSCTSIGTRPC